MGKISIIAKQKDNSVEICIKDTGVGMSDEALKKIFKENQHFTSSGTDNEQGTGLGLMLVKDFIKKNDGTLNVTSSIGQGTEFTIKLPETH
jgi:signal transduction histidine kinase